MSIEKRKRFIINIGYYAIIVVILYLLFKYLLHIIMPFLLAFLFSALMQPLVRLLINKFKLSPRLSSIITLLLLFALMFGVVYLIVVRSASGIVGLVDTIPNIYVSSIEPALKNFLGFVENIANRVDPSVVETIEGLTTDIIAATGNAVTGFSGAAVSALTGLVGKLPSFILSGIIFVIAMIFILVDYANISGYIFMHLPESVKSRAITIKNSLMNIVFSYGKSYLLIMLITFAELSLGLLLINVPRAFSIAAVTALLDIFPVVGSGLVLLPWGIFSIFQGNIARGIGLLILYVIVSVIRQIIEPRIVGRHVGLHPLATLICMFVGVKLFGGVGLLALPITVAILKNLADTGVISLPWSEKSRAGSPEPPNKSVYD